MHAENEKNLFQLILVVVQFNHLSVKLLIWQTMKLKSYLKMIELINWLLKDFKDVCTYNIIIKFTSANILVGLLHLSPLVVLH